MKYIVETNGIITEIYKVYAAMINDGLFDIEWCLELLRKNLNEYNDIDIFIFRLNDQLLGIEDVQYRERILELFRELAFLIVVNVMFLGIRFPILSISFEKSLLIIAN